MKLTKRILLLLNIIWNDLFGEESEAHRAVSGDVTAASRLNGLLDQAQLHLDALRLEQANAITRQKRIEHTWHKMLKKVELLQSEVDEALKASKSEWALTLLERVGPLQKNADEMAELVQVCEQHTSEIRAAIHKQQEQLDALRQRSVLLEDRENNLAVFSELFNSQQSLTRQTDILQTGLAEWEEQIARREDKLIARREWR